MNKICVWSKCHKSVEIHIRDTNLKLHWKARSWYVLFFFSTARIPFFLTPLCHSSFTAEILYPLFLRYSLFIIRISFPMSEHSFFFSFQISFSTALFHFIPWISVFLTLCSILHEVSFFFRIFRFPSLRIRVSLFSSLNFLPRKTKK